MVLRMLCRVQAWLACQRGASIVEWMVLAAVLGVAIYAASLYFGCEIKHELRMIVVTMRGGDRFDSACAG